MTEDMKVEGSKIGIGLIGGAIAAVTLNQWVAITTIIYMVLQATYLVWKWHKESKK